MGRRLPAQRQAAAAGRGRRAAVAPVAALDANVVAAVTQQGVAFGALGSRGSSMHCVLRQLLSRTR